MLRVGSDLLKDLSVLHKLKMKGKFEMKKAVNMRLDDDVLSIIDRQIGETFTDKFRNLVFKMAWEIKAKEEKIKQLDKAIAERNEKLSDLKVLITQIAGLAQQITRNTY